MSRPLRIALAGIGLLALVWYFSGFEHVPVTERVGMSVEARLKPFLAAERFSGLMGLPARELRALPDLDHLPANAVLLLPRRRQSIEAHRAAQLVGWVARGGHLIVEAEFLGVPDPVLERLGVVRRKGSPLRPPLRVEVSDGSRLTLSPIAAGHLEAPARTPRLRVGAPGAARVLSFARGKGLATAVLDLGFARNYLIGEHDHAVLLWRLLSLQPAGELLVFHHPERLSLWGFVLEHAPAALAAAGALLALWLWRIAPRYGTVLPDPPPVRRRLLDHLRASGRYLWAQGLRGALAGAAREAALRRVTRAYPDFAAAPPAARAARLAALAGLSAADAALLLAPGGDDEAPGGAELIRLVHAAQRVHVALERGNP